MNKYSVSGEEIKRRKMAFLSLSLSLLVGTFLGSRVFQYSIAPLVYLFEGLALVGLGLFSGYFFKKISKLIIRLKDNDLEREVEGTIESYPLAIIKRVKIKWTTHKSIREIYIYLKDGRSVFLTGLKDFEGFRKELLVKLDKQTAINEWREPMNFDGWWFYPVLGLLISIVSVFGFTNLIN